MGPFAAASPFGQQPADSGTGSRHSAAALLTAGSEEGITMFGYKLIICTIMFHHTLKLNRVQFMESGGS